MNKFWFHYNKPKSQKEKKPQISIHYKSKCIIVDNLYCKVITNGKIRKTQPFFVMEGKCKNIEIIDNKAFIE